MTGFTRDWVLGYTHRGSGYLGAHNDGLRTWNAPRQPCWIQKLSSCPVPISL